MMVNDTRDDLSKVVPGQVKPEPRRCIVTMRNGEVFSVGLSMTTMKMVRRSGGKLSLKDKDGKEREISGKDIKFLMNS